MPIGAKCVLLKLKLTSIITCAEMLGLRLEGLIMLDVSYAWSSSLSHSCISNILSLPLRSDTKWFFHVLISPSSKFLMYMSGGANWWFIWFFYQKLLRFHRLHCLSSDFLFGTLFQLGNCSLWSRLSNFTFYSDSWVSLLILCWYHSNTGGIHTCFSCLKL